MKPEEHLLSMKKKFRFSLMKFYETIQYQKFRYYVSIIIDNRDLGSKHNLQHRAVPQHELTGPRKLAARSA